MGARTSGEQTINNATPTARNSRPEQRANRTRPRRTTEPQRQALMADIDAWRDQREERADEARMQRYKEQARDRFAEQEARRGGQQGMEGDPFDRLPSRVRERIESMPEAERVALMQRLSGLSRDERRAEIRKLMRDRD